jgi:hypothetical protein
MKPWALLVACVACAKPAPPTPAPALPVEEPAPIAPEPAEPPPAPEPPPPVASDPPGPSFPDNLVGMTESEVRAELATLVDADTKVVGNTWIVQVGSTCNGWTIYTLAFEGGRVTTIDKRFRPTSAMCR